jgi:hypothetical protein
LTTASIAVPKAFRYIFWAIATAGDRRKEAVMDWAHILANVTGTVDQELLARNQYLATENRILKDQLKGRLMLPDGERATLGEIGHRQGRKVLAEVATVARPDTILAWCGKPVARKLTVPQSMRRYTLLEVGHHRGSMTGARELTCRYRVGWLGSGRETAILAVARRDTSRADAHSDVGSSARTCGSSCPRSCADATG